MQTKGKTILLIINNCSSHIAIENLPVLSNVEVFYLPPNTTSNIQPCDAVIIRAFKCHYRKRFHCRILDALEKGEEEPAKIDVLEAILMSIEAWKMVKMETIANCFKHCNIRLLPNAEVPVEENCCVESAVLEEVEEQVCELGRKLHYQNPMDIRNLLNYTGEGNVHYIPEDNEIINSVRETNHISAQCPVNEHVDDQDDSEEVPRISISQALESIKQVELCLLQQDNTSHHCSKGRRTQKREQEPAQKRRRMGTSTSTGCPFKASIRKQGNCWKAQVEDGEHNHGAIAHKSAHPQGRALTDDQRATALILRRTGVPPARILTTLRQDSGVISTPQDIYNICAADRTRLLAGRTPLAALLDNLSANTLYFTQHDVDQTLTHLFIVSPAAKEICQDFSAARVWIIDATYKTNKYNFPLLHIIGITATNTTFTFVYSFMKSEATDDYIWAMRHLSDIFEQYGISCNGTFVTDRELALMNALSNVFPMASCLLCRWHINKNIFARQRREFATEDSWEKFIKQWNVLVAKDSIVDYEIQLQSMRKKFSKSSKVMCYIEETWLIWKERFVTAFLRNKCHYGHVTTSRAESAHAALKKWISVSTGNLLTVDTAVRLACDGQLATITQENARQRAIVDMQFVPLFRQVMGKISVAGLHSAFQAYKRRYEDGKRDAERVTCGGLIKSTIGHPCRHELLGRSEPLSVNDFHQQWWLRQPPRIVEDANNVPNIRDALKSFANKYTVANNHHKRVLLEHILEVPEAVQEPTPIRTRGRPTGSTRRDPSQFEHVENPLNPPRRRRCGRCNREGHNARTCDLMEVE